MNLPKRTAFTPGLKTKLQISFLIVGLLTICLTGILAFLSARDTIEILTFDRLTSIRETKRRQIEAYFAQLRSQVITLSEDRMTIDALNLLQRSDRPEKIQTGVPSLLTTHPIFKDYADRFGFDDLFLVRAVDGKIVYSVRNWSDCGQMVRGSALASTSLGTVSQKALEADSASYAILSDFSSYPTPSPSPAAFIASPVFDHGTCLGALVFRISTHLINEVMTSGNNWATEGLGSTGETYLIGEDFTMRTDSRFFVQQREEYFRRIQKVGVDSAVLASIRRQGTSILFQRVDTRATREALSGVTATRIVDDYRGVPVLSSYCPLAIPGVHWVILSEMDTSEAFGDIFQLRERLILIGLIVLLASAFAGVVIARTISKPLLSFVSAAEGFGSGDFTQRVSLATDDELGLLAGTFNTMAERIMAATMQLKDEIGVRKQIELELRASQLRLRNLSMHLQTVREEERKGLAREIHDELGQALTTIKLNLNLLGGQNELAERNPQERLGMMVGLIDATIKSVRRMITNLRPQVLDDLGITAAIEWQASEFADRTGIPCDLTINPENIKIDADRSTAIFRILQEAFTNIVRHARAHSVSVLLVGSGDGITLTVHDDGIGIRESDSNNMKSFGLIGIRERAAYWGGTTEIRGVRNEGTTIVVHFPLEQHTEQ